MAPSVQKWFDIFNNEVGSGTEYTTSKFGEHTKPTHERRAVIQRDPDRLAKWVSGNLLKSNNTECKVLHQDW